VSGVAAGDIALSVLQMLPGASTLVFDRDLRYLMVSGQALARHGVQPSDFEGKLAAEVLAPERWQVYEPLYRSALNGETRSVEVWSTDETRCYEVEVGPFRDSDHKIMGGVAVSRDITPRRHAEESRRHAQERFELVFEQAPIGMALLGADGRWVRVNHALLAMTGYTAEQLLSKTFQDITHPEDLQADLEHVRQLLAGEIRDYQMEKRYFHADGHVISTVLSVSLVRDRDGKPLHFISQIQDISDRKLMEERLRHLAEHDPLTGLHNRRLFENRLAAQVGRSRRYGEEAAVLVIDLDGFKQVNDTYGHKAGDDLLKLVATELQRRLRGTDLVARLGGDEFAVLLPHIDREAACSVAEDIRRVIADCRLSVAGKQVGVSTSIGVAAFDQEVGSDESVLMEADRAMYAAKEGRSGLALGWR
jgi:diguanylate cyclase (GGDEF)-like protein/PAS domain S-box-containing protein